MYKVPQDLRVLKGQHKVLKGLKEPKEPKDQQVPKVESKVHKEPLEHRVLKV